MRKRGMGVYEGMNSKRHAKESAVAASPTRNVFERPFFHPADEEGSNHFRAPLEERARGRRTRHAFRGSRGETH
jgi:hypothetical protein